MRGGVFLPGLGEGGPPRGFAGRGFSRLEGLSGGEDFVM